MRRIRYLLEIFGSKFPYTAIILRLIAGWGLPRAQCTSLINPGVIETPWNFGRLQENIPMILSYSSLGTCRPIGFLCFSARALRLPKRCRLMSYSRFHRLNRSIYRRKIVDLIFTHWQIIFRNLTSCPSYKKLWSGNWGSVQPTTFCSLIVSPQFQNKDFRDGLAS